MPSIKDVAKLANVSPATVSKVIHKYPSISQDTRLRVLEAIRQLDYIPNNIASSLSKKSFDKIALIINVNNNMQAIDELNMKYLFGAFKRAKEANLEVMIVFSNMIDKMTQVELINYFKSQSITGIVFYGMTKYNHIYLNIIETQAFYCVIVDAPIVNKGTTSVMIDHVLGQYEVAKRTLTKDCQNILYLAGNENGFVTDLRRSAIEQLEHENKLKLTYHYANFSEKEAFDFVLAHPHFDAYICASDLMAIGALKALNLHQKNKPISGFDGINLMGYVAPHILTVKQDFYQISYEAIKEIERLFNGQEGRQVLINHQVTQINYQDVMM